MTDSSNSAAHRFLLKIADDLSSGDVNFPTFLDAAMKIRMAMNNPNLTVDELARIVSTEALVSAKAIRLSNSVALNPSGREISDVKTAVIRVGFGSIRTLAISVAMEQLMLQKEMGPYLANAKALWEHSIEVAALSFVIAKRLTKLNPHEAMFAGLVHDIGHFYLLSQIAQNPGIARDNEEVARILYEWHASIGHAVLGALEAPELILTAVADHENALSTVQPTTLAEVLYSANLLAEHLNPFAPIASETTTPTTDLRRAILEELHDEVRSISGALAR
jgi:HD-like signal output (HDOD) protein